MNVNASSKMCHRAALTTNLKLPRSSVVNVNNVDPNDVYDRKPVKQNVIKTSIIRPDHFLPRSRPSS